MPLAREIHNVLGQTHTGAFTLGLCFAVFFASSGIESLRIGLNRAYDVIETRHWLVLRLESIAYVLLAALASLALGFLIVLGPLIFRTALLHMPWLEPLEAVVTVFRFGVATVVFAIALFVAHKWLPAGHRRVAEIIPGIAATVALWMAAGVGFGRYLAEFSVTYVSYYAGLASAMIALVFLYWTATIFVFGGALNAALFRPRARSRPRSTMAPDSVGAAGVADCRSTAPATIRHRRRAGSQSAPDSSRRRYHLATSADIDDALLLLHLGRRRRLCR